MYLRYAYVAVAEFEVEGEEEVDTTTQRSTEGYQNSPHLFNLSLSENVDQR